MIVRELITRLVFSADNASAEKHEKVLRNITKVAIGTATAIAAISVMTARSARDIDRMSRIANAGTTEFQRMAAATKTVGIESDKLSDILKDMNDRVGDFAQTGGGPMLDFFEQIGPLVGVTIADFKELSGPAALQLYVSSLEKANLSQADMVFFMGAIASDSTALIPILGNGAAALDEIADRAEHYGTIMSEDLIKSGNDFMISTRTIGMVIQGLKYQIGELLLPQMTAMSDGFIRWYDANGAIIRQSIATVIEEISRVMGNLWNVATTVADVFMVIVDRFGGLEGAAIPLAAVLFLMSKRLGSIMWVLKKLGLLAALDDLSSWMNGEESVIGRLVGSYEDFANAIAGIDAAISDFFEALGLSESTSDMLSTLTLTISGLIMYKGGMILLGGAASTMGAGIVTLSTSLAAMGGGAVAKGIAALVTVASLAAVPLVALGGTVGVLGSGIESKAEAITRLPELEGKDLSGLGATQLQYLADLKGSVRDEILTGLYKTLRDIPSTAPGVAELASPTKSPTQSPMLSTWSPSSGSMASLENYLDTTVHVNLPAGAPATQKAFVEQEVVPVINQAIEGAARRAAANYPRAE